MGDLWLLSGVEERWFPLHYLFCFLSTFFFWLATSIYYYLVNVCVRVLPVKTYVCPPCVSLKISPPHMRVLLAR